MESRKDLVEIVVRNKELYEKRKLNLFLSQFAYEPVSKNKLLLYGVRKAKLRVKGKSILDIGFGNGLNIFSFDRSNSIHGIEIVKNMVDFANERAERKKYRDHNFQLYEGYGAINFGDKVFDFIICSHVLEHVPDDHFLLREVYRMLKDDGASMILVPIEKEMREEKYHARVYEIESFRKAIECVNFRIIFELKGDKIANYCKRSLEMDRREIVQFVKGAFLNIIWSKMPFYLQKYIEDTLLHRTEYSQYLAMIRKRC